jgi:hypothetical protein
MHESVSIIKLLSTDFSPIKLAVKGQFLLCYLPQAGFRRRIGDRRYRLLNPFGTTLATVLAVCRI